MFLRWLASSWYLFEFRRTIADTKTFTAPVRTQISLYLLKRMDVVLRAKRTPEMPSFLEAISQTLTEAHDLRHHAVSRGANSGKDPEWNAAALLESWSGAILGAINYRISKKVSEQIDTALIKFVTDNLTEQEIRNVVEAQN